MSFTATNDVDGRVVGYTSPASEQEFTFDKLGRLTRTRDHRGIGDDNPDGCTTRTYGFSAASERTNFASYAPTADGTCQTTTPTVSKTNTYDTANRITNTGYTYDNLGRTRTTPRVDTNAVGNSSALTATYHPNDMIASLAQTVDDGTATAIQKADYNLDPTRRISRITTATGGTDTDQSRYHFSRVGDAPTSTSTRTSTGTGWSDWASIRYLQLPGLGLAGTVQTSSATWQLVNLHGDVVADQSAELNSFNEQDEFGKPLGVASGRFGWLGRHRRPQSGMGAYVLMGVRLYNPLTGTFATPDPVLGGNVTAYTYPQDPINSTDLDGKVCIAGWGNCSYDFHRRTGSIVHASNGTIDEKLASDHNVRSVNLISWIIYNMNFWKFNWLPAGSRAPYYTNYRLGLRRMLCGFSGCSYTGEFVEFVISVNWFDGQRRHGRLRTIYCNNRSKCPDWVNRVPLF